jgi:hypothetical protein
MDEHRNDAGRPGDADDREDREPQATGDVLGISRPPVEPAGDEFAPLRDRLTDEEGARVDEEDQERRPHVGSRDVTEGTTGGTTPDTGGSGVFRRGSGATGTDIGS